MPLLTFNEAIDDSGTQRRRHLLLGNGFSIACRPNIFVYKKLFEQADFSKLSPSAKLTFEAIGTSDFERVIKALGDTVAILSAHAGIPKELIETLQADAQGLKDLLVETIATSHPGWPGEISDFEYKACSTFLSHFHSVYTLNYDLLLYWTQMHAEGGREPSSDDGFRKPEDNFDADYVTWEPVNSHGQNTFFLHGALHLFDAGTEIQKYTWVNTGTRLIEQVRDALERSYFPIFVAEGTSEEKLTKIQHNFYLSKALRSFAEIGGALFVYGHSLAANDDHYLRLIERGKLSSLYVGIYGDPNSSENRAIMARAHQMAANRSSRKELSVRFYDSNSASVWGH